VAPSAPFPIEVALADGTVLRGIEHPADGPPLLFVHDLGDDLDAWGSVAPDVRSSGFRVICLELRGHGLSDGEPDPSATVDDVTGALAEVWGTFGPCGLVAYGTAARAAFELGSEHGSPVHAVISPAPGSGRAGNGDDVGSVQSMRVVFTGAHDEPVHEHVRTIYPKLRGQNMWISTGTALRGPALLQEHPHLVEQLVMFMRRHLTAYHLSWIAEHAPDRQDSEESGSVE
jgi:pimeloyl-ACP methyl ester carboxylesterase